MKRVWKVCGDILFWLVIALAVAAVVLFMCGFRLRVVLTGSMSPQIPEGSVVITRPVEFDELQEGDVITFESPDYGVVTTHQIIAIDETERTAQTQGTANPRPDSTPVGEAHILGKVLLSIPEIGYCLYWFGAYPIVVVLLLATIAAAVFLIKLLCSRKNKEK